MMKWVEIIGNLEVYYCIFNGSLKYVPQNEAQNMYVPQVPENMLKLFVV